MIKSNIGSKIRQFRNAANLSQGELAKKVGVARSTISSWETDRTEPSIQEVELIAEILDCTKEDILGDYRKALLDDLFVQRMLMYAQKLSEMQKKNILEQMEYMDWKNKEEGGK